MSISQDNKGTTPGSCTAHDVAPHWSLTPPKEQSAIVKLPSNFLHLTKHTRETKGEWELGPVLTLSFVQDGGLVDTSSQCKASFGYCICNKSFLFHYPTLLTVHSFLTGGFIYSALKDSEITGHIDTAINYSSYAKTYTLIYVCMVMLLYWWVFTRTMRAVKRHRLYANELFCWANFML